MCKDGARIVVLLSLSGCIIGSNFGLSWFIVDYGCIMPIIQHFDHLIQPIVHG